MNMRKLNSWLPLIMLLLATACKPAVAPSVTPTTGPVVESQGLVKQAWEGEWQKTLAAARQEGKLVMYTSSGPSERTVYTKAMGEKYGLEIDFIVARGAELAQKLLTERRAGLYYGDVYMGGASTTGPLALEGVLDPLRPVLLLPEVLDTKNWYGNKLPFMWEEYIFCVRGGPRSPIAINKDLVKPEEIASYKDLLNPKFKGKIIMGDPTTAGGTSATVTGVAGYIMDWDFIRELAKQEPLVIRNDNQVVEWMARGKYPVAFGAWSSIVAEFKNAGAPLLEIIPKEGSFIEIGTYGVTVVNKRPHPNAARIFVNWFLSKEGQTLFAEARGYESIREDVSKAHVDPRLVRQPGVKYILAGEDFEKMRDKALPTIKEIFALLMK